MSEGDDLGEVIVEFTRNGPYVKCSAIHVATGREVSALAPVHEPKSAQRVAIPTPRRAPGPPARPRGGCPPRARANRYVFSRVAIPHMLA